MSKPTVAIVGRPNVGKSTLFNRILGGRPAIVSDRPGTTRDRHFGDAEWQGRRFWVVDTGGLVPESDDSMDRAIRQQVEFALAESDVHDPVNIGNPNETSLIEMAKLVSELTGAGSEIVFEPLPIDDPQVRQPDISRARELLDWEPEVELRDGLQRTIEHYRRAHGVPVAG